MYLVQQVTNLCECIVVVVLRSLIDAATEGSSSCPSTAFKPDNRLLFDSCDGNLVLWLHVPSRRHMVRGHLGDGISAGHCICSSRILSKDMDDERQKSLVEREEGKRTNGITTLYTCRDDMQPRMGVYMYSFTRS